MSHVSSPGDTDPERAEIKTWSLIIFIGGSSSSTI
jgi:hypothetical protein